MLQFSVFIFDANWKIYDDWPIRKCITVFQSFLGDVGLIKVVSVFGFGRSKSHFAF